MEDRETARMRKHGESKMTRIMMATVPYVTSGLGLRKFQADGFLLTRVYIQQLLHNSCLKLLYLFSSHHVHCLISVVSPQPLYRTWGKVNWGC